MICSPNMIQATPQPMREIMIKMVATLAVKIIYIKVEESNNIE